MDTSTVLAFAETKLSADSILLWETNPGFVVSIGISTAETASTGIFSGLRFYRSDAFIPKYPASNGKKCVWEIYVHHGNL